MMLYDDPVKPEYFLWRLLVDARYQGMGFGRQAIELLIDYVKTRPGATELLVSHGAGRGQPRPVLRPPRLPVHRREDRRRADHAPALASRTTPVE